MKLNSKKMLSKLISAGLITIAFTQSIYACDIHGQSGFLPENKMRIPVGLKANGGLTEAQFNTVLDKVERAYSSFVSQQTNGQDKLVIERRWTDETVNAYATQENPGEYRIVMFGGLARHEAVNEDAMALVACHELGHHMGGAPRKNDPTGKKRWASNEGQADYWGTMKCLRNLFENDNNDKVVKNLKVPAILDAQCRSIYTNTNEIALCKRTAMAGYQVGRLFNDLSGDQKPVDFNTPDKNVVTTMFDAHPASQCRLDTYFQASLCDHGFGEIVSTTDANVAVCSEVNGDKVGNRPKCWYKAQ